MKFTGYEDHEQELKKHNKESFSLLSDSEKKEVINDVFNIYRGVGIYPVTQFDDEGIRKEVLSCLNKNIPLDMDFSKMRFNQGGAV